MRIRILAGALAGATLLGGWTFPGDRQGAYCHQTRDYENCGYPSLQACLVTRNGVGGTCSGDSGGPAFWVNPATGLETNVVMAVNSYSITKLCNGVDYQQRTDIEVTLDFVTPYLH